MFPVMAPKCASPSTRPEGLMPALLTEDLVVRLDILLLRTTVI